MAGSPERLVISGGTVADGTGAPPAQRDVVVSGGVIEAVVACGAGPREAVVIDATGAVVTPGFIDPHTHLDAQLFWDPTGAPSVRHGVTSVVVGNCGFGVAPCALDDRLYLLRSLEATEEIPYSVTTAAVPMSWTGYCEYLDALDGLALGVNVACLVPHSALRLFAMGRRALTDAAGPDDVAAQVTHMTEARAAGALGLSTSRGPNHHDGDGRPVASRQAGDAELEGLVAACRGGVWQVNLAAKGGSGAAGAAALNAEVDRYARMTEVAGARLTWTPLVVGPGDRGSWRAVLDRTRELARRAVVAPQVTPQAMTGSVTFDGPSFAGMVEGWQTVWAGWADRTEDGRREILADPAARAELRGAPSDCSRVTSPCYERWQITASPSRPELVGRDLASTARAEGRHPVDLLFDLALADELATLVQIGLSNLDHDEVAALVADPATLLGLGDAGAHVRSITNYAYPTTILATYVRDEGRLSLSDAVSRLTRRPAEVLGLADRGVVASGYAADLCVVTLEKLSVGPPVTVADLPGGARRLDRPASGYRAVIVNGQVVVDHDVCTGRPSGTVLRAP